MPRSTSNFSQALQHSKSPPSCTVMCKAFLLTRQFWRGGLCSGQFQKHLPNSTFKNMLLTCNTHPTKYYNESVTSCVKHTLHNCRQCNLNPNPGTRCMKFVWCASVIDQKGLMEGTVSYQLLGASHNPRLPRKTAPGSVAHIYRHEITIKSPKRSANEGCAGERLCWIWCGLKHKWKEDACNRYLTNPTLDCAYW